jgi:hypothetical protein
MSDVVNKVVPIDVIKPHPENYNMHPPDQIEDLEKSLGGLGQYRSIVLWEQSDGSYIQLAGHGVVEAMKVKGYSSVRADVHPSSLDPMTAKRILIADNLHAQKSSPDDEMLVQLLQEQQDAGFDLAALGSSDDELLQMLEALDTYVGNEGESEEDDFDEESDVDEEQTRVKPGDIWQLGRHKIACLSSTDRETYKKLLRNVDVTLIWSDPPYGISIVKKNGHIGGGEDKIVKSSVMPGMDGKKAPRNNDYAPVIGDDSKETAHSSFDLCRSYYPKALQIWWGANHYADGLPSSSCWLVWDKENDGTDFADAELAWCSHKSAVRIFRHKWNGMRRDSEQGVRRVHPNQKPCALFCWAAEKYGKAGDIVFDPFLGSGISIIGAEMLNDDRVVYGCELSPEYINVVLTRWERHTGQSATLLERVEAEHV